VGLGASIGPVYLSHIVLGGAVLVWAFILLRNRGMTRIPRPATNIHLFLAVMLAWYLVTSLWSPNKVASLRYLFYLCYGAAITFSVVYCAGNVSGLSRLVKLLLAVLGVETILALLEAFTTLRYPISPQSPLAGYFGREMLLEPWALNQGILAVVASYPTGFRWNPNNLATVLNLFLPFVLFRRGRWLKNLGAAAILVVVLMTSSKINIAAWLMITAAYAVFFSKRRGLYTLLLVLGATVAALSAPLVAERLEGRVPQSLNEVMHGWEAVVRFFSDEGYVGDSVTLRRNYLENGLAAVAASNGLGVGAGCSGEEIYQGGAVSPGASRASLHNYWLEMAVDGGLLFAALFWIWYGYLVVRLLRCLPGIGDPVLRRLASASALSMMGTTVAAMGAGSVVYEPALWLVYGLAIASLNLCLGQGSAEARSA
jgi:hypothetical protein